MAKQAALGTKLFGGVSTTNASFGTAPSAGETVTVKVGMWNGSNPSVTVSDNQSNSYTQEAYNSASGNGSRCAIFRAKNVTSSGTFTITLTFGGSGYYGVWTADSYDDLDSSAAVDLSAGEQENTWSRDAEVNPLGTNTDADQVIEGVCYISGSDTNVTLGAAASTGYTNIIVYQDAYNYGGVSADYKYISAIAAQSITWSHDDWANSAVACSFKKAAGGAPAGLPPSLSLLGVGI